MFVYFLFLFKIFTVINSILIKANLNLNYLWFFLFFLCYPESMVLYLLFSIFFIFLGPFFFWVLLLFLLLSFQSPYNLFGVNFKMIIPLNVPLYVEFSGLNSPDNLEFPSLILGIMQILNQFLDMPGIFCTVTS